MLRNGEPFMALGTPGGDNQEQTILQAFLEHRRVLGRLVSRTCTRRSSGRACRRCTSTDRSGRTGRLQQAERGATIPDAVFNELKARGHDVSRLPAFGMSAARRR